MRSDILLILVLVILLSLFVINNAGSDVNDIGEDNKILKKWKDMDRNMAKMTGSAVKQILPHVMETTEKVNISSDCLRQCMTLLSGVRRLKLWAFNFVDSSSKIIDGMLSGTINSFGVYEQCLNSEAPSNDPAKPLFRGQYCQVDITPPLPPKSKRYKYDEEIDELESFTGSEIMNFLAKKAGMLYTFPYKVGLCLPSGCKVQEVNEVINAMAEKFYLSATVNYCEIKEPIHFLAIHIFAIIVCCILITIVSISTGFEIYSRNKGSKCNSKEEKVILSFSLISNFDALFSTKSSFDRLECIHGILFLGLTMAILINTYLYPLFMMHSYSSLMNAFESMRDPMGQVVMNSHVVVDTFFVISGTWICYMVLKLVKPQGNKLDIKIFILHKLFRFAPLYYFILLVSMLTSLMGSGPIFHEASRFSVENCRNYWWRNVLFINNFFDFEDMCLSHSWYISCDFQLYLSTLLVLLPILKSETTGLAINVIIIVVSMIYTGIMTYVYDLIPGLNVSYLDKDFRAETYLKVAANPLTHAGPYFIGVLVGYTLTMKPNIKIPKKHQIIGWIMATLCAAYTMLWTILWRYYSPSLLETSIFSGLHRTIWATGVAWMLFCCCTGHGGFINSILTWKVWFPLSRLVLLMYLIQPTIEILYIGVFKSPHEFTHFELIITYLGFLMMSGILAVICSFLIESPVLAIEEMFFTNIDDKPDAALARTNGKHTNGFTLPGVNGEIELNDFSSEKCGYVDNKAYEDAS